MKDRFNKIRPYFNWGLTAFIVIACGIMFYFGVDYLPKIFRAIGGLFKILSPFICGLVIAYLLVPVMRFFEKKWFRPLFEKLSERKPERKFSDKLPHTLALLMSEVFLVLIFAALIYMIVPQLYESIETIIVNSPDYIKNAYDKLDKLLMNHPDIEALATNAFGTLSNAVTNWTQKKVLPGMENIVTNIRTGVVFVVKLLYNLVIGIIVSVYILNNKSKCRAYAKKLLYCLFSAKNAKKISSAVGFVDKVFMSFITGKLVESAIVGILCYICCAILRMPYALLVSVIIGVLNIIPFFGMYIGAVPTGLLILIMSPVKGLIFVGLIIVLHIIDNYIIAPKVIGDSIGINDFWVIFAIIFFGGLFGVWGMLLGVPIFVIIYNLVRDAIDRRLEKQELPCDEETYMNLDYIDPETGKAVMRKTAEEETEAKA